MGGYHIFNFLRAIFIVGACTLLLGTKTSLSYAQELEEGIYDVILEVKRDRQTLAPAIFALEKDGQYYLPLQEISRLVKFKTDVSLVDKIARGFFIDEDNQFSLNLQDNSYSVRGEQKSFDSNQAIIFEQQLGIGDIYVTPELLNQIWPLDIELNPLIQLVDIQTKRKLPYELIKSRIQNRNKRLNKQNNTEAEDLNLPRIGNDYKIFSLPALDVSFSTRYNGQEKDFGQNINLRGRNDLLKAQADYNFSFDKVPGGDTEFSNSRLLLERKSYDAGDMPLGLQLAQAGDIRPRTSRLIDGTLRGRGVLVSTEPQKQIRDFDQITVEGTGEPGWEVELYRGNELVGFEVVDAQGEYRFEDVTLTYNETLIKTILYGPEGQVKEIEKIYNISSAMLKPGASVIEASLLDLNQDLIESDNSPNSRSQGFAQNLKYERGINRSLSAFTTYTGIPTRDDDRQYVSAGINFSYFGFSGLAEAYKDISGGEAFDFRVLSSIAGASVNVRNAFYSDFESPEANFDGLARKSRTEVNIIRSFRTFIGNLGLRLRYDHERFEELDDRTEVDFSQTYANKGLRITHANTFNLSDGDSQNTDGRVSATYRFNPNWQLRYLMNYDIEPDSRLRNVLGELRYRDGNKFTTALDVERNIMDDSTSVGGQVAYDFEKFKMGLNVDWNENNDVQALWRTTFSMAPYGPNGDYIFDSKNLANKAAYNGRLFLDKNYNGVLDEDDHFIEDASVEIGRRGSNLSNNAGYTSYIGASSNDYENITIDADTLKSPFTIPATNGVETVLRPGVLSTHDFAAIETGHIDGTVVGPEGALAGVRMQLLQDNEILDTTMTAYDGFYTFEYIVPGNYAVQIDPSYEQINIPPKNISVSPENLFLSKVDFQILGQAGKEDCACRDSEGRITQDCLLRLALKGMTQPAPSDSCVDPDFPTVQAIRTSQSDGKMRLVLDFDKPPNFYRVSETKEKTEISLNFYKTNWFLDTKWEDDNQDIVDNYLVEFLPDGTVRIILLAADKITIKKSATLMPNGEFGHRIYFDFMN